MNIFVARTSEHYLAAVELFKEYAEGLGIDLQFQKFDNELQILPTMYGPPTGELWLVQDKNRFVGCTALRQLDPQTCELKRMFVIEMQREKGVASIILKELEGWIKELGFTHCILETGVNQPEAISLYKKNNYTLITNYGQYTNAANSVCFEKIVA